MNHLEHRLAACLVSLALCGAGAAACAAEQKGATRRDGAAGEVPPERQTSAEATAPGQKSGRGREGGMKVLAEGSYGQTGPFVAVAREPRVYDALRRMAPSLPELAADFFKSSAVVAVFVGRRNTGGHAVEITHEGGGRLRVAEHAPPADAVTTQVITHPFRVVAVPVGEGEGVSLVLPGGLAAGVLRPYRVTAGELDTGGRFRLEGGLGLARRDDLLTVLFDLRGASGRGALVAAATGFVGADGRFSVAGVDRRSLVGGASGLLRAAGRLSGDGGRLQLTFESPAGPGGVTKPAGRLEAVATGPAPASDPSGASMY